MAGIYPSAAGTFIWLGSDSRLDVALRSVQKALDTFKEAETAPDHEAKMNVLHSLENDRTSNLGTLYQNRYWQRLWIVQEIILSKSCTLLGSQAELAWCDFRTLMSSTRNKQRTLASLAYASGFDNWGLNRWFFCMILTQDAVCEDVRDKIYGMQSIFKEWARIPVDYTVSPSTVFLRAMCAYERAYSFASDLSYNPDPASAAKILAGGMGLCDGDSLENLCAAVTDYLEGAGPCFLYGDAKKFQQLIEKHIAAWDEASGASRNVRQEPNESHDE